MARAFSMVVLALFLGHATGFTEPIEDDECAQPCPGESSAGHCPPACQACVCCVTARPAVLPRAFALLPPEPGRAVLGEQSGTPLSPEPREILHVPKPSLA